MGARAVCRGAVNSASSGLRSPNRQPVASRYTDYTTRSHNTLKKFTSHFKLIYLSQLTRTITAVYSDWKKFCERFNILQSFRIFTSNGDNFTPNDDNFTSNDDNFTPNYDNFNLMMTILHLMMTILHLMMTILHLMTILT